MQIHKCKHCGAWLSAVPEYRDGDLVLPCFACGALNLLEVALRIVGVKL